MTLEKKFIIHYIVTGMLKIFKYIKIFEKKNLQKTKYEITLSKTVKRQNLVDQTAFDIFQDHCCQ